MLACVGVDSIYGAERFTFGVPMLADVPTIAESGVGGFDVAEQPLEARKRIGYLPENPPLYTEMTVLGYLRFVAKIKGVAKR